jgi:hypothetical protein
MMLVISNVLSSIGNSIIRKESDFMVGTACIFENCTFEKYGELENT